jgi:hypothetical protein
VLDVKYVFHVSLKLLLKTFFMPKRISQVALDISTETNVGLHVKWLLKLSNLNENLNDLTIFLKILQYQIS